MKSWRATFRPQSKRLRVQLLTTIRSEMNEVEVINIFKRYSDKKTKRDKNHQRFYLVLSFGHIKHILGLV